ncbi:MAG: DUF3794 domain-containing protein [Oscillospiraceae bacterium]|jgi:hypothetical protein|nr:DUF3794 domain-containing protein [Oscillospiraceae bacterium]
MELSLGNEKLSYAEHILTENLSAEETMEMIVPDALPDILRIVHADAEVMVREKDADSGRVTVRGIARAYVLYSPEDNSSVRRVAVEVPYSLSAADPRITADARVTARIGALKVEANAANPRKVSVRVSIAAQLGCYRESSAEIPTAPESDDEDIELLSASSELSLPTDVREKTFVITDEYALPNANAPIAEILSCRTEIVPEEPKIVGSKLIFKGVAHTDLLYATPDGEIAPASLQSEFSQIIELEGASAESEFELIPLLTGSYIEPIFESGSTAKRVSIEIHAVGQVVAVSKRKISYVADAYGTKFEVTPVNAAISFENRKKLEPTSTVLRGVLPASGVSRIISVSSRAGSAENNAAGTEFVIPVYVSALYISGDGQPLSASGKFEVKGSLPGANAGVTAQIGRDAYGAAGDGGIEIRVPVEICVTVNSTLGLNPVSALTLDEDTNANVSGAPSLVIARARKNDTLWSVAKRYRATPDLVSDTNSLDDDAKLSEGAMLVIPRKR